MRDPNKNPNINPQTAYIQTGPVQYLNREGALRDAGVLVGRWGGRALISGGKRALEAACARLTASLDSAGVIWSTHLFAGECCDRNIAEIAADADAMDADVIIGVGGGKALDSAKGAADARNVPIVCVPTIAATCAATSALCVVYTDSGEFERDIYMESNPELVLVEPDIIANAPVKYLESGIMDSLSKWFEGALAIQSSKTPNIFALSAVHLALLLKTTMNTAAVEAVKLVKERSTGDALNTVVDLNVYSAGVIQSVGLASTRGAVAHSLHGGLSLIDICHGMLHGFKVGYGIIVQMFIEGKPIEEINETVGLFRQLDLEPSLKGLGIPYDDAVLEAVARKTVRDPLMTKMPFVVTEQMIVDAMREVERHVGGF